jgi:cell division protein FtsI (penicillin-binding protein 3)
MLGFNNRNKPIDSEEKNLQQRNVRLLVVKVVFLGAFLTAAVRLVQIQIIDSAKYKDIARKQYEAKVSLPATRGDIYDRNGVILASNTMFVSFAADPKIVGDAAQAVAEKFSRFFGKPESYYLQKFKTDKRFVWLERYVRPDLAKELNAGKIEGVVELNEPKRLYHFDETGGQVIGCTNLDNTGISGIEFSFDKELRGTDGYVIMQRDGLGRKRPSFDYPRQDPVDGHSISLTIDITYQSIVDDELKKGVIRDGADRGVAIMLQPYTGEVLAMSTYPGFNPNNISGIDMETLKNRAITDMVEPGSVFKIVTAAAALQSKLVTPDRVFYAEEGKYKVPLPGGKFRLITDTHDEGNITFERAVEVSSNIVMAKVSDIIGPERLYTEARNFGFGMETGIDLPGEIGGDLKKPVEWSGETLNSMAYGYEVGVTPLQLITAYAAVANGGLLMKPYILSKEVDENGNTVRVGEPEIIRRVVSEETATTLKNFFIGVVEHGTGQSVRIPGITIAGKTGTSRKFANGQYESGDYNASFVGFFPAEHPQMVILVMVQNPKIGGYTGAMASAPIFKGIAERIINNNGLLSKIAGGTGSDIAAQPPIVVPDVVHMEKTEALKLLRDQKLQVNVIGSGDLVVNQFPEAGGKLMPSDIVRLITDTNDSTAGGTPGTPDLTGLSLRRAVNELSADRLEAAVVGSGMVVRQYPAPGARIKAGTTVTIICQPKSLASAELY